MGVKDILPDKYPMIIPIKILLMDKTIKTFNVSPYSLVKDVESMLHKKCRLKMTEIFSLYELDIVTGEEHVLNKDDRVLDVLGSWESHAAHSIQQKKINYKKSGNPENKRFLYKARLVVHTSNHAI